MSFSVDTTTLAGLPALLDRLHEDARQGSTHLDRHTTINWTGEGIINVLAGGHRHVQDQIRSFLDAVMTQVAAPTANAVRDSIKYYESVDHANAAALDRTYPPARVGEAGPTSVSPRPAAAGFDDIVEPRQHYTPPPDYNGEYPHDPRWYDLISPGAVLRNAIWTVTGVGASLGMCDRAYDPYDVVLKPLVGDWAGVRACAEVFRDLADAVNAMSANILGAAQSVGTAWTGQAASACGAHLVNIANALRAAPQPLREIAREYERAAVSMNEFRATIGALLNDTADAAIMAAASAGVVALAGATGVGLPAALIISAFTLSRIYKVVHTIVTIIDLLARLEAMNYAISSAQHGFGRIDATARLPALPTTVPVLPS